MENNQNQALSKQQRGRDALARHKDKDRSAYNKKQAERYMDHYHNDPLYRERLLQRKMVYNVLKGHKSHYLPYTVEELRSHLESLWLPGMTWENYGKRPDGWCLDHIISIKEHIANGERSPSVISALSNIRPLWIFDNESKGAKKQPVNPTFTRTKQDVIGEKHPLAKLTVASVRLIKQELATGTHGGVALLAKKYGVSYNAIQQIKQGKSWAHVSI